MSDDVTIYHNPHCSKSRQTLQLLEAHGVRPTVVEYLRTPPDEAGLRHILDLLGVEPRAIMRSDEAEYRAAGLDDPNLSRDELIRALLAHPRLIQRPIVISGNRAVLGRPPEKVLEILR